MNQDLYVKKIDDLITEISKHRSLYYNDNRPIIEDYEYDALEQELETLLSKNKQHINKSRELFSQIGTIVSDTGFERFNHLQKMLSLDKITNKEGYIFFLDGINRFLKTEEYPNIIAELKFDGLSISLTYEMGLLTKALTRGDGIKGEDVTKNVRTITDIPKQIESKYPPRKIEIRGEIIMAKSDFIALNNELKLKNEQEFVSSRNAAAGSLRQLNPLITAKRRLSFIAYSLGYSTSEVAQTQLEVLKQLKVWGFKVVEQIKVSKTVEDISNFVIEIETKKDELPFELDGIVCKINDIATQNRLGDRPRSPRWAVAWKFSQTTETSRIKQILFQISRLGHLTPVAIFEPVFIDRVKITRASLHNIDEIKRLDVRIDDKVRIKRCGGVIPQVDSVIKKSRTKDSKVLELPTVCPSCKSILVKREGFLFCLNENNCKEQQTAKAVYLADRDRLDIHGLGKKIIKVFVDKGFIKNPVDIFLLKDSADSLQKIEGVGVKTLMNIFANIEKSKKVSFARAIYCLAIPSFGSKLSQKLAKIFPNYNELVEFIVSDKSKELIQFDGIGISNYNFLRNYFMNQENLEQANLLISILDVQYNNAVDTNIAPLDNKNMITDTHSIPRIKTTLSSLNLSKLADKKVVLIGGFSMSRKEVKLMTEREGAVVIGALSSQADILVIQENPKAKIDHAKKLEVEIIEKNSWKKTISTNHSLFKKKNIAFTGDMSLSKNEVKELIVLAGAKIKYTLDEQVKCLIVGDYPKELIELAVKLDVNIMEENEWRQMISDNSSVLKNKTILLYDNLTISNNKAKKTLAKAGAIVTRTLTEQCDYLIIRENPKLKIEKANKLGVNIIDKEGLKKIISTDNSYFLNSNVVFMGDISLSKNEVKELIELAGAKIKYTLDESTNYLIVGDYSNTIIEKAENLNVDILDEEEWKKTLSTNQSQLYNKKIVFTGTLSMPRKKAQEISEQAGAVVINSLNKLTNYLIAGEKPGSKIKTALDLSIPVLEEEEWKKMLS